MHLKILIVVAAMAALGAAYAQDESHCERSCGDVSIMFPFGSGEGCYYNSDFLVTCNQSSSGEQTLFLGLPKNDVVITNMSTDTSEMEIMMFVASDCYNISGPTYRRRASLKLAVTDRDFQISTKNKFIAIGCDTHAYFNGTRGNVSVGTGCISRCGSNKLVTNGSCSGVGCCEVAVPEGMNSFRMSLSSYNNHTNITDFNPCSYGFFVQEGKFSFSTTNLLNFQSRKVPMLLDWGIGNSTCDIAKKDVDKFLCRENSICDKTYKGRGYRCNCSEGYEGNPYVRCNNVDECQKEDHGCVHICNDEPGNYTCKCRKGYSGDGRKNGTGCTADQSMLIKISVGSSFAAIVLIVFVNWLYFGLKKRKLMILREKFFKQNGGILLQQRISGDGGSNDQAKVFTVEELKRATNNYHDSKIIGKGGYGTVYKGVLSDSRTVAIKKSKLADQTQTQIEQFINEVVILSQINHRNVVKLIGCCLETEVPLLVYEFIPNGTLSDHIHNKGKSSAITWDIRLRIATETAEALSYLHSAASVPVIHRDVKPTNILLDDSFVAKVADFGASRLVPMDQIELETMVQGTLGYLDPEYMQTNQLTDKSDVYSFGVVLVELMTGKKALSFDRPEEERNLAMHFLSSLKQGRLFQILDEQLQKNDDHNEIIKVSTLAARCLHVQGDERPTMKEVAMELEGILASLIQKHPWVQSTLNEDEAEYLLKGPTDDYECTEVATGSSSTFDSISKLTILPIASGR
ncbi:wall-associated receptor kinase 2 [Lactuca sativa]|uniref:Protein kinase domain-containing protein n=1 Tax=Lactuca sativa TaxID=4236 RepID=A0A9R1X223_LACSA|nr:wall-associated receptor kinase 2 [Lactuca sativa]KAJ0193382.1 hypothetical protein LSAT_V11C800402420 [Lactuca sativa]